MKPFIPKDQQMSIKEFENRRDRNKAVSMNPNYTNKIVSRKWNKKGIWNNKPKKINNKKKKIY